MISSGDIGADGGVGPSEDTLSPDGIEAEAASNLSKKGFPGKLRWIPLDEVPRVRWRLSGEAVSLETLRWWIVQAYRLKSPQPGALLRRQLEFVHPSDRSKLARAVLEAWIQFDTMPYSPEEARAVAQKHFAQLKLIEKSFTDDGFAVPEFDELLRSFSNAPGGSAIQFKGLLAISAACGDGETGRLAG